MGTSPFERATGETLESWLARLEAIDPEKLPVHTRTVLHYRVEAVRSALRRAEGDRDEATVSSEPDLVEQAKEAYRRLAAGQRQQFSRWLSQGAP